MYSAREVTSVLGLSPARLRSYLRSGFVTPSRGERGELRFTFQDLVLLRKAEGLVADRVPSRRVHEALRRLQSHRPSTPLAGVSLRADGQDVVVDEGQSRWRLTDGQVLLDFDRPRAPAARQPHGGTIAPLALARGASEAKSERRRSAVPSEDGEAVGLDSGLAHPVANDQHDPAAALPARLTAQELYDRGCALEESQPELAREAYRRALALDPNYADAHVNLGRLLHEAGHPEAAQDHYRIALACRPEDSTAAFNLGVALEDLGRNPDAIEAYERALTADASNADAHYNVARLYEQAGKPEAAILHLRVYRQLTRKR